MERTSFIILPLDPENVATSRPAANSPTVIHIKYRR